MRIWCKRCHRPAMANINGTYLCAPCADKVMAQPVSKRETAAINAQIAALWESLPPEARAHLPARAPTVENPRLDEMPNA